MPAMFYDILWLDPKELTTPAVLLRVALAACSMTAMVYLFRLWGTRYGDNNALSKSFVLSLILHFCFGLGWATVAETYPPVPVAGPGEFPVQTAINLVDDIDSAPTEGKNPRPIWHLGSANSELPLTRDTRNSTRTGTSSETEEIEAPEMNQAPVAAATPQELPQFQNENVEPDTEPELERSTADSPKPSAAPVTAIDTPTDSSPAEISTEVSTKVGASRSATTSPTGSEIEAPLPPDVSSGGNTRKKAAAIDDGDVLSLPSDVSVDDLPRPQGTPNNENIRRPGSSDPTTVIDLKSDGDADLDSPPATNFKNRRTGRSTSASTGGTESVDDLPARAPMVRKRSSETNRLPEARSPTGTSLANSASGDLSEESPKPRLDLPRSNSAPRSPARASETYRSRSIDQRMSSVLKNGGSEESERAVENSLRWLADVQEGEGNWSAARFGGGSVSIDPHGQARFEDGKFADTGVTGLVILSFLGAGYSHEKGPYTAQIRSALEWMINQQDRRDGYLRGKAKNYDQNYCHAIATFALAEAYAMQKDAGDFPELRLAVRLAVRKISELQNVDGGWRYSKTTDSDMSMFGWQLMALKSAVNAGISVNEDTRRGMIRFLAANALGDNHGLAGYKRGNGPTPPMTAEAMFCRQMFAVNANDSANQEGVAYLMKHLPRITEYDEYYWYYGTLALRNADKESWKKWNDSLRDMLVSQQRKQGVYAGSWDPKGKWAGIGGRLYSTALSTMCLEVYYRYQSTSNSADE